MAFKQVFEGGIRIVGERSDGLPTHDDLRLVLKYEVGQWAIDQLNVHPSATSALLVGETPEFLVLIDDDNRVLGGAAVPELEDEVDDDEEGEDDGVEVDEDAA